MNPIDIYLTCEQTLELENSLKQFENRLTAVGENNMNIRKAVGEMDPRFTKFDGKFVLCYSIGSGNMSANLSLYQNHHSPTKIATVNILTHCSEN